MHLSCFTLNDHQLLRLLDLLQWQLIAASHACAEFIMLRWGSLGGGPPSELRFSTQNGVSPLKAHGLLHSLLKTEAEVPLITGQPAAIHAIHL